VDVELTHSLPRILDNIRRGALKLFFISRHVIPLRPQLLRATIGVQSNHSRPPSSTTCANSRRAQQHLGAMRRSADVSTESSSTATAGQIPLQHADGGPRDPPRRLRGAIAACLQGRAQASSSNRTRHVADKKTSRGTPSAPGTPRPAHRRSQALVACQWFGNI
jgi:hypothetical protein